MSRFDWSGLMRAGMRGLGLRPTDFWELTPAELHVLLGGGSPGALGRNGLDALMAAYPDKRSEDREDEND